MNQDGITTIPSTSSHLELDSSGLPLIPQPTASPSDPLNYPKVGTLTDCTEQPTILIHFFDTVAKVHYPRRSIHAFISRNHVLCHN